MVVPCTVTIYIVRVATKESSTKETRTRENM